MRYAAHETELAKAFNAKVEAQAFKAEVKAFNAKVEAVVKVRVRAEMARLDRRAITDAEWVKLASYFHADKRKHMAERDWDRAFSTFMSVRDRVAKPKGPAAPVAPDLTPQSPQQEQPPTATLA